MRSYAAGNTQIFGACASLAPYVLLIAQGGERARDDQGDRRRRYFGGSLTSLGIQIKSAAALFSFETAWAAILVACILGISFYLAIALAEAPRRSQRYPSARRAQSDRVG